MKKRFLAVVTISDKETKNQKEYKVPAEKTWRFCRQDVSQQRAGEIGEEMANAMFDRLHNTKECIKHPFKSEKRELVKTKHHWE